jgi:glyoxylase-like metal-dependent hydrolase (beta-lactamase superfamily II)
MFVRDKVRSEHETTPNYEIYALRYATRQATRSGNFLGGDPHDGPMRMDYFIWYIRSTERVIVVDTGFTVEMARQRDRDYLIAPGEALRRVGVDPDAVEDVVLTHLHYDHAGNLHDFPKATFHIQDDEVAYATGRHMTSALLRHVFEIEDVVSLVRLVYSERVKFYRGGGELAPGITLHRIGGHSAGLQCVRVSTARGWVVLASDASHFYEHYQAKRVFPVVYHVGETLDGYRTLLELAQTPAHIIPGHDPLVMSVYPAASKELEGIAVRVDLPPVAHPNVETPRQH